MAVITTPSPNTGDADWEKILNTIFAEINTNSAPIANPTFTGVVTAPTINASTILQVGGTNIFSRNNTWTGSNSFSGITNTGGYIEKFNTITGTTTLDASYDVVLCNSTSAFTINLPPASSHSGRKYKIKNINSGIITIDANASETIDGNLTTQITNIYDSITLFCNGIQWFII